MLRPVALPLLILLLAPGLPAAAQQPAAATAAGAKPAAQPTPEQKAQLARQEAQFQQAANRVVALVDAGKGGDVWDSASPVAKAATPRQTFLEQIAKDRGALGGVIERKQVGIHGSRFAQGAKVPAGDYVTVTYATRFSKAAQPIRELVSLHLDEDKVWRVAGYTVH
ncbi:MAG: DUF4019 domain-containing protein [Pseudoxanthomonas sp.]